jgi:phosphohistidine phosphatase SixA
VFVRVAIGGKPLQCRATPIDRGFLIGELEERVQVYITRHGKAQPESSTGRDEDRSLRKRGERQARWLGEHFLANGLSTPGVILTSGRTRAFDTARILGEVLDCEVRLEPTLDLGHAVSDVIDAIEETRRGESGGAGVVGAILLVGHNPQLETLVGVLLDGPGGAPVRLRTGECAVIDLGEGVIDGAGGGSLVEMLRLED